MQKNSRKFHIGTDVSVTTNGRGSDYVCTTVTTQGSCVPRSRHSPSNVVSRDCESFVESMAEGTVICNERPEERLR